MMMNNQPLKMHIIALNNPYPPNYGGVIDIYYRIKALQQAGVDIILHAFNYGREKAEELEKLCHKVYYYPRKKTLRYFFTTTPFIVSTRKNPDLLENLCKDKYPILFDGIHTCAFLNHQKLRKRKKIVRAHNVEHDYYAHLAKAETNLFKKVFFISESIKLKLFENQLSKADHILSISDADQAYFYQKHKSATFIPAFIPEINIDTPSDIQPYVLIHGNLSVLENIKSLNFFLENVLPHINYKVIIAGMNPDEALKKRIAAFNHLQLIANPDNKEMGTIIANAKCILLHTFQPTGIKLKLLISLMQGNTCIVNSTMLENTGLQEYCSIANTKNDWIEAIHREMNVNVSVQKINDRRKKILNKYDNQASAKQIIKLAFA